MLMIGGKSFYYWNILRYVYFKFLKENLEYRLLLGILNYILYYFFKDRIRVDVDSVCFCKDFESSLVFKYFLMEYFC